MAKPVTLPRWATGGSAQITEPTESKKDSGWVPAEKPPAQYFNWLLRWLYAWVQYLDGLTSEVLTWAAAHTFNSTVTISQAPTQSTHAARKTDVDSAISAEVTARNNAISSAVSSEATARSDADATKASLSGANFTGAVTVQTPSAAANPARKDYVDARFVVAGHVTASGTISSQVGIVTATCTKQSTGYYTISVPGLTSNAIILPGTLLHTNITISLVLHSGNFEVHTWLGGSTATDEDFSFLVVAL